MPSAAPSMNLVHELNKKAVRLLVAAHRKRKDEPLVLAIWYNRDDPTGDIHLLEVLDQFPGGEDDELLETKFGPSANLRIVGDLHLALGSPAQVQSAIRRRDRIMKAIKGGSVVFANRSTLAAKLKQALGL